MKKYLPGVFLLAFSAHSCLAQLVPSTIAQVYHFEPGDSLEYSFRAQWDDNWHSYSNGYALFVVTGVVQDSATLTYTTQMEVEYTGVSNPLHYPPYGGPPPFSYSLSRMDTSVFYGLSDLDTSCNPAYDSVYINQDFNGRKQNEVVRSCFESGWSQKFVDSLGQVSYSSYHSTGGTQWEGASETLVYYHKVNGETWGTPYYFNLLGLPALTEKTITLSPNPATTSVTVSIDETMLGSTATISDVTGRKMAAAPLSTVNCQLSTESFSSGVYFVTLTTSDGRSATKKLVVSK